MSEKVYSIEEISQIILPLIKNYRASKVILFGSYARNEADKDSDIDVLVIGGDAFEPTDVFCIADELNRLSQKKVDVYEEREINHTSAFYNTIISEGVEIAWSIQTWQDKSAVSEKILTIDYNTKNTKTAEELLKKS